MTPEIVKFGEVALHVVPDQAHHWLMATKEVARGYGVSEEAIRSIKSRHAGELVEGKHFLSLEFPTPSGAKRMTCWTQRGVIRLGFLGLKGEAAAKFRDWAEDLALQSATAARQAADSFPIMERVLKLLDAFEHRLRAVESVAAGSLPAATNSVSAPAGDLFAHGDPYFVLHELAQRAAQEICRVSGESVHLTAIKLWNEAKRQIGWSPKTSLRAFPGHQLPLLRGAIQRVVLRAKEDFPDLNLEAVGLGTLN